MSWFEIRDIKTYILHKYSNTKQWDKIEVTYKKSHLDNLKMLIDALTDRPAARHPSLMRSQSGVIQISSHGLQVMWRCLRHWLLKHVGKMLYFIYDSSGTLFSFFLLSWSCQYVQFCQSIYKVCLHNFYITCREAGIIWRGLWQYLIKH